MKKIIKISFAKTIKINFIFGFILLLSNNLFSQNCSLPNGKYRIEFDKQFEKYPKADFKILNDSIIIYENDSTIKRKIEKNYDCLLVIEKQYIDETNLTDLQKIINRQHPYYTFKQVTDHKFKFIYRVDLHVIINSGEFIKLNSE